MAERSRSRPGAQDQLRRVATTLGIMWGLSWPVGGIACAAWLLFAALAALLSVVVAAIAAWFQTDHRR